MPIHLIETGRHQMVHAGSAAWSAGTHAALVASVVIGAWTTSPTTTAPTTAPPAEREVVYLLPMLPSTPLRPHDATPSMPIAEDRGRLPVPNGTRTSGTTATDGDPSRRLRSAMLASLDSLERVGAAVYRVAELERAVERDPLSAAPAYPSELEQARVEGDVTAEWVVDTVGRADTTSFRVVSSTHPRFLEAVRAALPLMHFRPAQLQGRRVQQLVRQEFNFRLVLPAAISAHEAAAAVAPRVP